MSPYSLNGMPSPGYQCPTSVYQPSPQQVYSLTQTGQQVLNAPLVLVGKLVKMNKCSFKSSLLFPLYDDSVQLVGCIATSLSTTKVFSHNLAWLHKTRSCSPSRFPSRSTPTGETSSREHVTSSSSPDGPSVCFTFSASNDSSIFPLVISSQLLDCHGAEEQQNWQPASQ